MRRSRGFAGVLLRFDALLPAPENRGVPGSSPGLAIFSAGGTAEPGTTARQRLATGFESGSRQQTGVDLVQAVFAEEGKEVPRETPAVTAVRAVRRQVERVRGSRC